MVKKEDVQRAFGWIARQGMTGEDFKVFAVMFSEMDFVNFIRISQTELSEKLNMTRSGVSRAIRHLLQRKIFIEGPRAGLNKTYMFNINLGKPDAVEEKKRDDKIIDYADAKKRVRKKFRDNNK